MTDQLPPKPSITETVAALASPKPPDVYTRWHIERSVPVAVILTIIVQTFLGIWWFATLTFEVHDNSRRLELSESLQRSNQERAQPMLERFYKLESQVDDVQKTVDDLKIRVDRNEEFRRQQQKLNSILTQPKEGSLK